MLDNAGSSGLALVGDGFWSDGVLAADALLETPGQTELDTAGAVILGRHE